MVIVIVMSIVLQHFISVIVNITFWTIVIPAIFNCSVSTLALHRQGCLKIIIII